MRRVIVFALMSVLLATSAWLSYTAYFLWQDPNTLPIEKVQVEGAFHYVSRSDLENVVLPFVQRGFLHVEVERLRATLLQNKMLKEARIVRVWPNKLWIEVVEHQVVARWKDIDSPKTGYLSDEGSMINTVSLVTDQSLPLLISAPGQTAYLLQMMQQINKKLEAVHLPVTELVFDQRHALKAKLSNDVWLILGKDLHLTRVTRFAQVYDKLTPQVLGKMRYIDLRYTNGMAVKIDN